MSPTKVTNLLMIYTLLFGKRSMLLLNQKPVINFSKRLFSQKDDVYSAEY